MSVVQASRSSAKSSSLANKQEKEGKDSIVTKGTVVKADEASIMTHAFGESGDLGRSFSSRLRELRRAKALSLRNLGREVGVTANAVLRWEKDEVTPTRSKMLELSRYFDVEPAWLAWGIGARRHRLKPADLLSQLVRCDEVQLRAVSALLEAFDANSVDA